MKKPPVLKPTLPPLLVVVTDATLMIAGPKVPDWLTGTILGGALVWLVVSVIAVRGNVVERWPWIRDWFPFLDPTGGLATRIELAERHIQGKTFHLADVAINGVVVGKTFDDCIIHGPVVIAPQGATVMRAPYFHGTRGDIIYDFEDKRTRTGMLVVEDCTFNKCIFYDVGIAQDRSFLDSMTDVGKDVTNEPPSRSGDGS